MIVNKTADKRNPEVITLSDRFTQSWIKAVSIIVSFMVSVGLICYLFFFRETRFSSLSVLIIVGYVIVSSVYDYYLIKSRQVSFNNEFIFIEREKKKVEKIALKNILKIKRKLFFFYKIIFRNTTGDVAEVFIFISPNPPFSEPKKIRQLKKLCRKIM